MWLEKQIITVLQTFFFCRPIGLPGCTLFQLSVCLISYVIALPLLTICLFLFYIFYIYALYIIICPNFCHTICTFLLCLIGISECARTRLRIQSSSRTCPDLGTDRDFVTLIFGCDQQGIRACQSGFIRIWIIPNSKFQDPVRVRCYSLVRFQIYTCIDTVYQSSIKVRIS